MIYFNVNIRNPKWWDRFANIKTWYWQTPIKHKYIELELLKLDNLLRIELQFTTQQDHAGFNFELGLFGYEVHFTFYDNRHWNYEEGRWKIYNEENGYH